MNAHSALFWLILWSGLLPLEGWSQGNILELLPGSERMSYNTQKAMHTLGGNVSFHYKNNTFYCDSAVYFERINYVKAYRKVHINKAGSINIFCDSLWFDGKTEQAILFGHVRARDQEYKLSTDTLYYYAPEGKAVYYNGGVVESIDQNEKLTSQVGYFYPEQKNFYFKGKVKYNSTDLKMESDTLQYSYLKQEVRFFGDSKIQKDSTLIFCHRGVYNTATEAAQLFQGARVEEGSQVLEADTIFYQPKIKRVEARHQVCLRDSVEKFQMEGQYALKDDSLKRTYFTRDAFALYEKDSLFVHADTLFALSDSLDKPNGFYGYKGVRIFQKDISGRCDSVYFHKKDNYLALFQSPILYAKKGELKADTLFLFLRDSVLDYAHLRTAATALFELDSGSYYNQIAGSEMLAFFVNNEVKRAEVNGSAHTIYYPEDEEETDTALVIKRSGLNRVFASALRVYLDSGEVTGITYFDQPDGKFLPINQPDPKEEKIQGFSWNPALRVRERQALFWSDEENKLDFEKSKKRPLPDPERQESNPSETDK